MRNENRLLYLLVNGYQIFIFLGMFGLLYFTQNPVYLVVAAFLFREIISTYRKRKK